MPKAGPKIKIVQPSIRRSPICAEPKSELARRLLSIQSKRSESFRRHSDIGVRPTTYVEDERELFDKSIQERGGFWDNDAGLQELNLRKLMFEGPVNRNDRRHSCDSISLYEKLRESRRESTDYKSLQKVMLVLPRLVEGECGVNDHEFTPKSRPREMTAESQKSHHTYASLTSELAGEYNRQDTYDEVDCTNDLSKVDNQDRPFPALYQDNILNTPANTTCVYSYPQNLTSPEHHTYESIPSATVRPKLQTPHTFENAVVIIGKRVSNPFEDKFVNRPVNKKKLNQGSDNGFANHSNVKHSKDYDDRYSPFPLAKKLAFKSAFKQVPTPKFRYTPACRNVNPSIDVRLNFSEERLEVQTPEIKVDNQKLILDSTEFVSPINILHYSSADENDTNTSNLITTDDVYQTFKARENLKLKKENFNTEGFQKPASYKKSLPSLSDSLEEDMRNYCNVNEYTRSTPVEPPPVCNYF